MCICMASIETIFLYLFFFIRAHYRGQIYSENKNENTRIFWSWNLLCFGISSILKPTLLVFKRLGQLTIVFKNKICSCTRPLRRLEYQCTTDQQQYIFDLKIPKNYFFLQIQGSQKSAHFIRFAYWRKPIGWEGRRFLVSKHRTENAHLLFCIGSLL